MKNAVVFTLALLASGVAWGDESSPTSGDFTLIPTYKPDSMIGLELQGRGETNRFFWLDLTDGANAMLHGYVPHEGDVVEWYMRDVKCDDPDKSCKFELAIRKKPEPLCVVDFNPAVQFGAPLTCRIIEPALSHKP